LLYWQDQIVEGLLLGVCLGRAKARDPIVYKRGPKKGYNGIFVRAEDLVVMSRDSIIWSGTSSVNNENLNVILCPTDGSIKNSHLPLPINRPQGEEEGALGSGIHVSLLFIVHKCQVLPSLHLFLSVRDS
jgi:hypothetical protein